MNDFKTSKDLLKKLDWEDVSETGGGNLGIDLQFKNRFKKDFIYLGIDNEKMRTYINCSLLVSSSQENIDKVNKINTLLNELLIDAKTKNLVNF